MSEVSQKVAAAAVGMTAEEIEQEIAASGIAVADPKALAAYIAQCAAEYGSG